MDELNIPNDETGMVLRRMHAGGDRLTEPRMVDFNFVFPNREPALAFVVMVDEIDLKVTIAYDDEALHWAVIVARYMVPSHGEISAWESELTRRARSASGTADGWGCLRLTDTGEE